MYTPTIFLILALSITSSWASTTSESAHFCYKDSDGCGPTTTAWAPLCRTGRSQSPINLPLLAIPVGQTPIKVHAYKGNSFRIQNNGHSVQVDFNNQGQSAQLLAFPDPNMAFGPYSTTQGQRQYKFSSAHFHWGINDWFQGSEHCIGGKCAAMEIHLVHYLAKYPSQAAAVASGDPNALAVVGILVDVGIVPKSPLAPIANNLRSVATESSAWKTINQPLDLSIMLFESSFATHMYTYKGSLTTPGCNEQVNWYVMKRRAVASKAELQAFRSLVKDGRGQTLSENHRPLQPTNGRKVLLTKVIAY